MAARADDDDDDDDEEAPASAKPPQPPAADREWFANAWRAMRTPAARAADDMCCACVRPPRKEEDVRARGVIQSCVW